MNCTAIIVACLLGISLTSPALAAGEIVITQAKALAGNVTPGDTAGYPVTISQPGAYVFESNLSVTPGTYGLYIGVNNVDIDMNGFTLSGVGSGTFGVVGNAADGAIHGGSIKSFQYSGIYLRGSGWMIEDMKIVQNGAFGVDATGARFISVSASSVRANGGTGVRVGDDGRIETSNISSNGAHGVLCEARCYIAGSSLNANARNGAWVVQDGGHLLGNVMANNGRRGFVATNEIEGAGETIERAVGYGNNSLISNTLGPHLYGSSLQPNYCAPQVC